MNLITNLIPFRLRLSEIVFILKNITSVKDLQGLENYLFSLLGNPFVTDTESLCSLIENSYGVKFSENFKIPKGIEINEPLYSHPSDIFIIRIVWNELVKSILSKKDAFITISLKDLKTVYPNFSKKQIVSKSYEIMEIFFYHEKIKVVLEKPYIRRNSLYIRFK